MPTSDEKECGMEKDNEEEERRERCEARRSRKGRRRGGKGEMSGSKPAAAADEITHPIGTSAKRVADLLAPPCPCPCPQLSK